MTCIKINDKYTVLHENGFGLRAERYGEPWRDCVGDGLILAMADRIEELEAHKTALEISVEGLRKTAAYNITVDPIDAAKLVEAYKFAQFSEITSHGAVPPSVRDDLYRLLDALQAQLELKAPMVLNTGTTSS